MSGHRRRHVLMASVVVVAVLGGCSATRSRPAGTAGSPSTGRLTAVESTGLASSSAAGPSLAPAVLVGASKTASGNGFWVAGTNGSVHPEGDAVWYGDASGVDLAAPVVGIATTPTGRGYWLLGGDGGVFTFGDAGFYGSTGDLRLNQPAIQMVATRTGRGYWFVARDGGVFTFGDARFYGSTGDIRLNQPIVGMAATPTGDGYWLVARDGGVFTFGDARFYGSTGDIRLNQPIVGMAPTPTGRGYWLVARDGGTFSFGDARFFGSGAVDHPAAPAIGLVRTGTGRGYWIILGNGTDLAFGDAASVATTPIVTSGYSLVGQVVTIDPGHNGGNGADPAYINQLIWNGVEWETCDTAGSSTDAGYTEAAFNFDVASHLAALLRQEGATVVMTRTSNDGVGPCVNVRAAIGNAARSDAVIDIHADGGPPGGRGVAVLEPVPDGINDAVIASSGTLALDVRDAFVDVTGEPLSSYDGINGLQPRDNLAGLNLTTVPKVLIECANMRNAMDAALVSDPTWRQLAAEGLDRGLSEFLIGYP